MPTSTPTPTGTPTGTPEPSGLRATVTLARGATSITLPAPEPGYAVRVTRVQHEGRSAAGDVRVYDKGVAFYETDQTFRLTRSQKEDLETFFESTIRGALYPFTYTDHLGVEHADARLLNRGRLAFDKTAAGGYRVTLRLRTQEVAD